MFKVNNKEHISKLVLVFLLITLNMSLPAGKSEKGNFTRKVFVAMATFKSISNMPSYSRYPAQLLRIRSE